MLIAIDISTLRGHARDRGIGRFAVGLVQGLSTLLEANQDIEIKLVVNAELGLPNSVNGVFKRIRPFFDYRDVVYYTVATDATEFEKWTAYNSLLQSLDPDVFLIPSPDDRSVPRPNIDKIEHRCQKAAVLHDLIPFIFPEHYINDNEFAIIEDTVTQYNAYDFFLSNSKATKNDFIKLFPASVAPVHVINGASFSYKYDDVKPPTKTIVKNTKAVNFCYVGGSDYRKNVVGLLHALVEVKKQTNNFVCHIVYDITPADRNKHERFLRANGIKENVVFVGKVTDDELIGLYTECDFGVFPSIYEGLGLPILEQIQSGTPVIGGNNSSIKEILTNPKALFDAKDSSNIAAKIVELIDDANLRDELLAEQLTILDKYNWTAVAKLALSAIKKQMKKQKAGLKELHVDAKSESKVIVRVSDNKLFSLIDKQLPYECYKSINPTIEFYQQNTHIQYVVEFIDDERAIKGLQQLVILVTDKTNMKVLYQNIGQCTIATSLIFKNTRLKYEWLELTQGVGWYNNALFDLQKQTFLDAIHYVQFNFNLYCKPFITFPFDYNSEEVINVAVNMNNSNVLKQNKRLFLDWSRLSIIDEKSGIQRVTRGYTGAIYNVVKQHNLPLDVFFSRFNKDTYQWEYKYNMDGEWQHLPHVFPGDVFFLLDPIWGEAINKMEDSLRDFVARGCRVYSILHDILPIYNPDWFGPGTKEVFNEWLIKISSSLTGIISVSEATQNDFIQWLANHNQKYDDTMGAHLQLAYVHNGVNIQEKGKELKTDDSNQVKTFPKKYYLVVGTLEPRKGHKVVLDAFKTMWANGSDDALVFVGKHGWSVDDLVDEIESCDFYNDKLFWYTGVDDALLHQFYLNSHCVIIPSKNEGFGLPVIEAVSYNKPVICSDIPVFKELAGDNVQYFDCTDSDSLVEVVNACVDNFKVDYTKLTFNSWEDSATQVIRLLYPSLIHSI